MTDRTPIGLVEQHDAAPGADERIDESVSLLEAHGLYLALLAAWIATLGSLYFSEVMHFVPCRLCWFQRIFMYPLAILVPIGLLRRDRGLPVYVLPLAVSGIAVSSYHLLVERGFIRESTACRVTVSCALRWINWFGFITIPLLAFTAFAIIIFASSAVFRAPVPGDVPAATRPVRPVMAIIGAVVLAFTLLAWWQGWTAPPVP